MGKGRGKGGDECDDCCDECGDCLGVGVCIFLSVLSVILIVVSFGNIDVQEVGLFYNGISVSINRRCCRTALRSDSARAVLSGAPSAAARSSHAVACGACSYVSSPTSTLASGVVGAAGSGGSGG